MTNLIHIRKGDLTDLLFRGKNKEYGAYYLRRQYSNHLMQGLFFFVTSSLGLILAYSIYNYIHQNLNTETKYTNHGIIELQKDPLEYKDDKKIQEQKVEPEKSTKELPKPTNTAQEQFTEAKIVDKLSQEEPNTTEDIITSTKDIGAQQVDGTNSTKIELNPTNVITHSGGTSGGTKTEDEIVDFAEIDAEYPGGEDALVKFIQNRIIYPEHLQEMGVKGTVYIRFVINEDGTCSQFTIQNKINNELGQEAIRVLSKMPKWTPAKQAGHEVKLYKDIPITFKPEDY